MLVADLGDSVAQHGVDALVNLVQDQIEIQIRQRFQQELLLLRVMAQYRFNKIRGGGEPLPNVFRSLPGDGGKSVGLDQLLQFPQVDRLDETKGIFNGGGLRRAEENPLVGCEEKIERVVVCSCSEVQKDVIMG